MSKYGSPESPDAEYEAGSAGTVLRNLLGITDPYAIQAVETAAYETAVNSSLLELESDLRFTQSFIKDLHRRWLGHIYPFAGQLRQVNVSKGLVTFCTAANVASQLAIFESEVLSKWTPCTGMALDDLSHALATVHVEFILIHPFREGNGRLGRWIAMLMAVQAGQPILDFSTEATDAGRELYFSVLRKGFAGNMAPAIAFFAEVLRRSS